MKWYNYIMFLDNVFHRLQDLAENYINPSNVVKCKTLSRGNHDLDTVLLHSSFQTLVDFIEKEQPWWFNANWSEIREENSAEYADDVSQLKRLYYWWKFAYPKIRLNPDEIYKIETAKIIEIVELRKYLWT